MRCANESRLCPSFLFRPIVISFIAIVMSPAREQEPADHEERGARREAQRRTMKENGVSVVI